MARRADNHTNKHKRTQELYQYATDQQTSTNYSELPSPLAERKLNRVSRREHASRHASPVARASSSCLTPTENQFRWGFPGLRPQAPGPRNPVVDEEVRQVPPPHIIRPKERNVSLPSNMGYLSGQNAL